MEGNMRKVIIFFISLVIFIGSATTVYAAGNSERYIEKRNFSIAVPEAWEVLTIRGLEFKVLRGAFENEFAPTINFIIEDFSGNLNEYMEQFMDQIDELLGENRVYILDSEFATLNGLSGALVVLTTFQQERLIQFNFFFFPGSNNRYMVITGANLAHESSRFNELFLNTVKTFEWVQ